MRFTAQLGLFAGWLLATACSPLWNRANVGSLEHDLVALFGAHGLPVELEECRMVGTTRSGTCRMRDADYPSFIEALQLSPVTLTNATIAFIDAEFEAGCGSYSWIVDGSGGRLHMISGRPENLLLNDGTRFEYLLLVYEESSGEACLQVSYAYG